MGFKLSGFWYGFQGFDIVLILCWYGFQGSDIVRDEDHVVKAVKEELDDNDFDEADLDELESVLEAAAANEEKDTDDFLPDDVNTGQRVYKDIEAARKGEQYW